MVCNTYACMDNDHKKIGCPLPKTRVKKTTTLTDLVINSDGQINVCIHTLNDIFLLCNQKKRNLRMKNE